MTKEVALGFLRHVLTFAGGLLVTNGIIGAGEIEVAVGAVVTLIGLGWSIWQKRQTA